ncbi:MAG: hypothetical protein INR62_06725, partial [Rhodospirillales bacterium]|nr:hypothetical protein [Acetobacter sp.]
MLAGNGNQTVTFDPTTATTIYSFSLNEDVSGVTNSFAQTAAIGGTTANTLLTLASTATNAFSLTASNGGMASFNFGGAITNTAAQTILSSAGGSIILNAGANSTATLAITSNATTTTSSTVQPTAINLGTGSLTIGNGG